MRVATPPSAQAMGAEALRSRRGYGGHATAVPHKVVSPPGRRHLLNMFIL